MVNPVSSQVLTTIRTTMHLLMDPSLLATLLIFTLFLLLVSTKRSSNRKTQLPPSPPKLPLIGNLHQLLGSLPHLSLRSLSNKYGPLMLLHLGQIPTLVITSPDMAKEIMKTHDRTFASRPPSKPLKLLFDNTIDLVFAPYSEYWRRLRKLSTIHLLSAKRVQSYRLLREEEVACMIETILRASLSTSSSANMSKVLNSFSTDIVTRIVSGRNFRENGRDEVFRKLTEENVTAFRRFYFEDFFPSFAWLDEFLGHTKRAKRNAKRWDVALDELIEDHVGRLNEEEQGKDFVDVLLSFLKEPEPDFAISMKQMKALLIDMFVAGTETTYVSLEWAMTELVLNPETLKKLQDEVRGIAKDQRGMIKEEEVDKMVYLRAVVKEVLRLHPPVPLLIPRMSTEDCQIQGYHIPKKTRVLINVWAIGRDPKYWEAPEEFRPVRFMNSPVDFKGNDFELIPFGAGRRICPGLQFAVSSVELALANLVHRFDWELPHGSTREIDMSETGGLVSGKKTPLHLLAKPWTGNASHN